MDAGDDVGQRSGGRVLVVCTGNICRSPYIERRLRQLLAGSGIEVSSAGTGAMVGNPIEPASAELLAAKGADVEGFAARALTGDLVAGADLVLTATRQHRGPVAALDPRALRYTFTLGEFADLVAAVDAPPLIDSRATAADSKAVESAPQAGPGDASWVARVVQRAQSARPRVTPRVGEAADIIDPYGAGTEAYAAMAAQIEAELPRVAEVLHPRVAP